MSTSTNPFLNNGTTASTTTTPSGRDAETITSNDIESAEPPPAYTPNERAGEESLQRGPNRPFQPAPPQPSQQPPWNGPHRPWQNGPPPPQGPGRPDFYQGGPSYNNGPPSSQGWGQYPGNSARAPQHPPPTSSAGGNHSGPAPEGSPTSSSDGCPTTVPTPGHPLLRDGKVLVYPRGHECRKCHNIGYKNYDPSHPCRKCWDKYAKPYSGAITYAPWANRGAETSYYQRPLPNFLRGPTNTLFHQQQQGQPQFFQPPPPPPPQQQFQRGYGYGHGPPPGAVVVQPGDPRIGGKTCWNCYGSGQVSIFLFDTDRCRTCNGMGRIL